MQLKEVVDVTICKKETHLFSSRLQTAKPRAGTWLILVKSPTNCDGNIVCVSDDAIVMLKIAKTRRGAHGNRKTAKRRLCRIFAEKAYVMRVGGVLRVCHACHCQQCREAGQNTGRAPRRHGAWSAKRRDHTKTRRRPHSPTGNAWLASAPLESDLALTVQYYIRSGTRMGPRFLRDVIASVLVLTQESLAAFFRPEPLELPRAWLIIPALATGPNELLHYL
jgi:hypothetical protein